MRPKGFTLIELLIAITILVIVSTIGFVSYSNAQVAARDSRRKNDLRYIQTALELYRQSAVDSTGQKLNRYPCVGIAPNTYVYSNSSSDPWIQDSLDDANCNSDPTKQKNLDSNFIKVLPTDPMNTDSFIYAYGYGSASNGAGSCPKIVDGNYYVLKAYLENANDPDANKIKKYAYCDGIDQKIFPADTSGDAGFAITSQ